MTTIKRLVLLAAIVLGLSPLVKAQNVIVTGTITDTGSTPYANGSLVITLVNTSGQQVTFGGSPTFQQTYSTSLDASGAFSISLPPNDTANPSIKPSGTQWRFSYVSLFNYGAASVNVSITGATDLTSTLSSQVQILWPTGANPPPGGSGQSITSQGNNKVAWVTGGSGPGGGVSSVALSLPSALFAISGSPVTSIGTLTGTLQNQNANLVFAGPASGSAAVPTLRALVAADIPTGIPIGNIGSSGLSGASPVSINAAGQISLGQIPISLVGSSGLSGSPPVTINSAGAIGCATCNTSNATIAGSIAATQVATGASSNTITGNAKFTFNATTGQVVTQLNCLDTPLGQFVFCGDGLGTVWNGDSTVQESIASTNSVWNYCMSNAGSTGQTGASRPYYACMGMDATSSAGGGMEFAYIDKAFATTQEAAGLFFDQATGTGNLGHNIILDAVNPSGTNSYSLNAAGYNEAIIAGSELVLTTDGVHIGNGISAQIAATNTTSAGCTLGLPQATASATSYVLTVTSIAGSSAAHPFGLCQTSWSAPGGGSGTITFPQSIAGTVNSGGIPYFDTTTDMSSSAVLPSGDFVLGGGAGGAPTASFATIPVNKGGTGTASTLTGLVRGSASAMTAAELSGDATTSTSNVVTVVKVNGTSVPTTTTVDQVAVTTASATALWKTIADTSAGGLALTYTPSTHAFGTIAVSGGISGLTTGFLPKASSGTALANSLADDGITTASTFTYSGVGGITASGGPVSTGNDGTHPGLFSLPGNTTGRAIVANFVGLEGPNTGTFAGYTLQFSATAPTAAGYLAIGAPSSGISQATYVAGTPTLTIANGTSTMGTSAIGSGACATVVTTTATGTATTDDIMADFNATPVATTGYIPGAMLTIVKYPTTNNVNFSVCNNTASSITPTAITLNWRVVR